MKLISLILVSLLSISTAFAETKLPEQPRSCREQLIESKAKWENALNKVSGGGFIAVTGSVMFSMAIFETAGGIFITLPAAAVGATVVAINLQNRKNAIALFEGAASGGNAKTEKLWRKANRIDPETFGRYSYQDFLNELHEADISGKACQRKLRLGKRQLIKLVSEGL